MTKKGRSAEIGRGDALTAGDKVRTGPGASLTIKASGADTVTIAMEENTTLEILPNLQENLRLTEGSVTITVEKPGTKLSVMTPVAAAFSREPGRFRTTHRAGATVTEVFKGRIDVALWDTAARKPRGEAVRVQQSEKIRASADSLDEVEYMLLSSTGSEPVIEMGVETANEAYFLPSTCDVENNVIGCESGVTSYVEKRPATDYADNFLLIQGDKVAIPLRAVLPWPESKLHILSGPNEYSFEGAMVVCIDYDLKERKLRIRVMQSRPDVEVLATASGTTTVWRSRNRSGLHNTTVRVLDGSVWVTTPWLCESCDGEKSFRLEPGHCFDFLHFPKRTEDLPDLDLDPPEEVDHTGLEQDV